MSLLIIPGQPDYYKGLKVKAEDLSAAIEEVYPMDAMDAILVWNGLPVSLNYKYDISVCIEEILDLVFFLKMPVSSTKEIMFPSNTFLVEWKLNVNVESVTIKANWHSAVHPLKRLSDYQNGLNTTREVTVLRENVIKGWFGVLMNVVKALNKSEILLKYWNNYERLRNVTTNIFPHGGS